VHDDLNVVHRDIKPDNIIIERDTNNIKLIDYGVSEMFNTELGSDLTDKRTGTRVFHAPELYGGNVSY